jgi:hypothetical protein
LAITDTELNVIAALAIYLELPFPVEVKIRCGNGRHAAEQTAD